MAYAQGDIILDDHYNIFSTGLASGAANHNVANINSVWGSGFGDKGYGQSSTLTPVAAGNLITATQWSTLIARLDSVRRHQINAGSDLIQPTTGNIVTFLSTLSQRVADAYNGRAAFFSRGATQVGSNLDTGWVSDYPTSISQTRTVTFAGPDQARYFFNAGGRINLVFSVINGLDNAKEISWTELINNGLGTFSLDYTSSSRSGSGYNVSINNLSLGFWDLTTQDQIIFRLSSNTAAYAANYVDIYARVAGTTGGNGGKGTQVIFTIVYVDNAADQMVAPSYTPPTTPPGSVAVFPVQGNFFDSVNMTLRVRCDIIYPETTYLTDTWGTATVS
jgi:hypothetical protein